MEVWRGGPGPFECVTVDAESRQLGRMPREADDTQRVSDEGAGPNGAEKSLADIDATSVRVHQRSCPETQPDRIDREVATAQLLPDRTASPVPHVQHMVVSDQAIRRLLVGSQGDEACRERGGEVLGEFASAVFDDDVDVAGRQSKKVVADRTTHDVAGNGGSCLPDRTGETMLEKRKETRHGYLRICSVPMLQAIGGGRARAVRFGRWCAGKLKSCFKFVDLSIDEARIIRTDCGRPRLPTLCWKRVRILRSSVILLLAWCLSPQPGVASMRAPMSAGDVAMLTDGGDLFLESSPRKGDGLLSFSRRYSGSNEAAKSIAKANRGTRKLLMGVRYKVPFDLLTDTYQEQVIAALFGSDRVTSSGWEHRVVSAVGGSDRAGWHIAEWFTGRGENHIAIRQYNGLGEAPLLSGQVVVIPRGLLRPALRPRVPEGPAYGLQYGSDSAGEYAVYRLKQGEALYSSVVIRFTGRVFAEDVNALAREIATRSGISDVTDIPIGYPVKVPFDLLQPEYLPEGNERRQAYEEGLIASSQFSNRIRASKLEGITVILDSGHGGTDVGASTSGVWESIYVYDIMVRVKRLLEEQSSARVIPTTRDGSAWRIVDRDVLPYSRDHRVMTQPPYKIQDSTVGVHLRWYLANSVFRQFQHDPSKVVFLSIHADSLHSSLRGAMAYIPSAELRSGTYGKSGAVYASRKEVREQPRVTFPHQQRVRSEGLSRQLANDLIQAFHREGLAVHDYKPVREKIIRKRRAWVPAVLRYNGVPAKVLLEVCNLANREDRRLLQTREHRQRVAEVIFRGLLDYYGYASESGDGRVAAR